MNGKMRLDSQHSVHVNVNVTYAHAVHTYARTLFPFIFHLDWFLLF